jgi:hypothetical protein
MPTGIGFQSGTLTFSDNAQSVPGSPQTVQLSGTGSMAPASPTPLPGQSVPPPTLNPNSLNFGGVAVSSTSPSQSVTVINTSNTQSLVVSAITVSSTGGSAEASQFAETDNCTATPIGPAGRCTISVTFTPAAKGPHQAKLTLTDNAPNDPLHPQSVSLLGNGQ